MRLGRLFIRGVSHEVDQRLPYRHNAVVDDLKLGYYLDESSRARPGSKVGIFRDILGFTDRESLRLALLAHGRENPASVFMASPYGVVWNVVGPMSGPSGRTTLIRTGWMIHHGSRTPVNTTAFRHARTPS